MTPSWRSRTATGARCSKASRPGCRQSDYVMLFTADHGEAFDRMHPRGRHDQSLHTAETHVPFVVQTPAQRGARRAGLASHLDVVPTVLDLLELEPDADLPGESLTPALFGAREPEKSFVTGVLWQPRGAPFGSPALRSAMLRTADWLYIDDRERGQAGLFEPAADPLGLEDRSHRNVEEAEWARWALRQALGTMPTP
jgi:arylsulfatase A-like enzyme